MKYKGIELTEITTPNIENLPKKMLVWEEGYYKPIEREVCATAVDSRGGLFFIARFRKLRKGIIPYQHCAKIPEEPNPRRATNRELSRWLAEGKGMVKCGNRVLTSMGGFEIEKLNETCAEWLNVQKWDDTDWHEPTVDYMGIEETK